MQRANPTEEILADAVATCIATACRRDGLSYRDLDTESPIVLGCIYPNSMGLVYPGKAQSAGRAFRPLRGEHTRTIWIVASRR